MGAWAHSPADCTASVQSMGWRLGGRGAGLTAGGGVPGARRGDQGARPLRRRSPTVFPPCTLGRAGVLRRQMFRESGPISSVVLLCALLSLSVAGARRHRGRGLHLVSGRCCPSISPWRRPECCPSPSRCLGKLRGGFSSRVSAPPLLTSSLLACVLSCLLRCLLGRCGVIKG